jgi:hypothetical protein
MPDDTRQQQLFQLSIVQMLMEPLNQSMGGEGLSR